MKHSPAIPSMALGQGAEAHGVRSILNAETPATMTIPELKTGLAHAVADGLRRLLADFTPEELARWRIHVDRDPEYLEPDDGLIRKDATDRKHYLHYRPDLEYLLHAQQGIRLDAVRKKWFGACTELHRVCSEAALHIAQEMDRQRPGYGFAARTAAHAHLHVVRILRYDAGYETAARWHADRCALTLHVAESEPGLVVREGWDERLCASPQAPNALVFPGRTFERITHGAVPALWHGAKDQSRCVRPRWVVVFFAKMKLDDDMF